MALEMIDWKGNTPSGFLQTTMNFCSNKAMREKEKKDFYNLHEIQTNVKGNKTNLKTRKVIFPTFQKYARE